MKRRRLQAHLYGGLGALVFAGLLLLALMQMLAPSLLRGALGRLSGQRGTLTVATAHSSGAYHAFGKELAAVLGARGQRVVLRSSEGSLSNLELLVRGEADLALVQGGIPDIDHSRVKALAQVQQQHVHLVVRRDSGLVQFADLAGRRIAVGGPNSGFAVVARQLIAFYRLAEPPKLVHLPPDDMEAALRNGRVDAVLTVYSLFAPAIENLLSGGANRLLPFPHAEAISLRSGTMSPSQIPAGAYGPNRDEPAQLLTTVSVPTLLVARADLGSSRVHSVLRSVFSIEFLERVRLLQLNEEHAQQVRELQLHEAARDYYARNAPISSDRFEIASFFIAAILAMASLLRYVQGERKREELEAKRQRIVPYFEELLRSGRKIAKENDAAKLSDVVAEMMELQHRAEREWLQGLLDTEHMENLYAVYDVRCRNAFARMAELQQRPRPDGGAS